MDFLLACALCGVTSMATCSIRLESLESKVLASKVQVELQLSLHHGPQTLELDACDAYDDVRDDDRVQLYGFAFVLT